MLKILLWILLGLIALVVILLHFSVKLDVKIKDNDFEIKAKYLFFNIYPRSQKPNKKKKATKNKARTQTKTLEPVSREISEVNPVDKAEDKKSLENSETIQHTEVKKDKPKSKSNEKNNKEKQSLKDKFKEYKAKWKIIKPYVPTSWKSVKKLLKTIRFTHTDIELTVGKEDAYDSAMLYGKVNAGLYNALAVLGGIFTMHYKTTKVNCVFNEDTFKYRVETQVCIRPSAVIAIAFCTLVNYLKIYLKQRKIAKKSKKLNETESA